jgi:hypothetical protein
MVLISAYGRSGKMHEKRIVEAEFDVRNNYLMTSPPQIENHWPKTSFSGTTYGAEVLYIPQDLPVNKFSGKQ